MLLANIYEAKTHLSSLIQKALDGDEVVIAKAGKPLVELKPYTPPENRVKFGLLKDKIRIADDFDSFDGKMEEMFSDYLPDSK